MKRYDLVLEMTRLIKECREERKKRMELIRREWAGKLR